LNKTIIKGKQGNGRDHLDISNVKKNRYLFIVVSFLLWFPNFLYVPVLSPYINHLGGNYIFAGIILSSYGITQLLLRLPIGIVSDLFIWKKSFIIFGMMASCLSCIIFLSIESVWWALIARALSGVSAATWVVFTAVYPFYYQKHEVSKAMSNISFIVVLGQFIGMSFSGIIVNEFGWKAPFMLGVIFSILGVILSFFISYPQDELEREPVKFKELTTVLKDSLLLKSAFLSIIAHSIIFSTMFGFTSNYAFAIGFAPKELAWVVIAFMIPHAIATIFIGNVLVPKLGEWTSVKLAFLLITLSTFIIPFVESKSLFLMIQIFCGFSLGLIFPVLLSMSIKNIEPKKRAAAMGAYQALYAIGIFAGPFFAGIFNSLFGINAGFYFLGILSLLATTCAMIWGRREKVGQLESCKKSEIMN